MVTSSKFGVENMWRMLIRWVPKTRKLTGFRNSRTSNILSRSCVSPPIALIAITLPWVGPELEKAWANNLTRSEETCDLSDVRFFEALVWLKCVFLQDMALLQRLHPSTPVFTYDVFSVPEWGPFSEEVQRVKAAAITEVSVL